MLFTILNLQVLQTFLKRVAVMAIQHIQVDLLLFGIDLFILVNLLLFLFFLFLVTFFIFIYIYTRVSLVLFQNIVPISLYVTIEVVKTIQAYFIYSDIDMYYEKLDYPCTPKTWNISDDLGQIEYIFSDKTGTLTQNVMEFRKCTINGVAYGLGETDTTRGAKLADNPDQESKVKDDDVDLEAEKQLMLTEMTKLFDNRYMSSNLTFIDSKLYQDLGAVDRQSKDIK